MERYLRHGTRKDSSAGFTLIELLVVVVIIALLASIIIASLTAVQKKARDARRLADVDTLRKALAIYATNGIYPVSTVRAPLDINSPVAAALIAEKAISAVPVDPFAPTFQYEYITDSVGTTYTLYFCLETNTVKGFSMGCNNTFTP